MLPRKCLIPLGRELGKIKSLGKSINLPVFSLFYSPNDYAYPRFAFIISKKVDPRAVVRHRIKRQLASLVTKMNLSGDYVFYVKKAIMGKTDDEITRFIPN